MRKGKIVQQITSAEVYIAPEGTYLTWVDGALTEILPTKLEVEVEDEKGNREIVEFGEVLMAYKTLKEQKK